MTKVAKISDDMYAELKRIQKRMYDQSGVTISMPSASEIYHRKKKKGKPDQFDISFR